VSDYGYIPNPPEQSFGQNLGIFTPKDIYDLTRADKYTNYGQLELIQTQEISSAVAQVDFTAIQEDKYNVHFVTWNGIEVASNNNYIGARLSNDGGSSYESSNYQYALQYLGTAGITGSLANTSDSALEYFSWGDSGDTKSGFIYFYNLGNPAKMSHTTQLSTVNIEASYGSGFCYYGSQVYTQKEKINAIRFLNYNTSGNFENKGTFSLYGIREYA